MDGSEGKPECVTSCSWKTAVVMIISFSRWLVMIMQTIKFGWTEWKHSAADFFFLPRAQFYNGALSESTLWSVNRLQLLLLCVNVYKNG